MTAGRPMHLRVSYVWRDEVMDDRVVSDPGPITVGPTHKATFTTPDLGLPRGFAILRPGARGYLLTLGVGMGGRARIGGKEIDVADFVARGGGERSEGAAGAFRATALAVGDWGVIHLDPSGHHVLFFQFVAEEPPLPSQRGKDRELVGPAYAFSAVVHGILLAVAFQFLDNTRTLTFPGGTEIAAQYLVTRPPPPEPPLPIEEVKAGTDDGEKDAPPASTAGDPGKSGGEGKKPRQRAPDPDKGEAADALQEKVMQYGALRHRDKIETVLRRGGFSERLGNATARLVGPRNDGGPGGYGNGKGTGVGAGEGTGTLLKGGGGGVGGGGTAHADVITQGVIKTGGTRPARGVPGGTGTKEASVDVSHGEPSGELGDLTAEEINRVVMSKKNAIRVCYERQLQRNPGLSGKIIIQWKIDATGKVFGEKVRSNDMGSGEVGDCIKNTIRTLKFPSPRGGTTALVNYPFIFAQH